MRRVLCRACDLLPEWRWRYWHSLALLLLLLPRLLCSRLVSLLENAKSGRRHIAIVNKVACPRERAGVNRVAFVRQGRVALEPVAQLSRLGSCYSRQGRAFPP